MQSHVKMYTCSPTIFLHKLSDNIINKSTHGLNLKNENITAKIKQELEEINSSLCYAAKL